MANQTVAQRVAEGILDAREYIAANTADADSVIAYAEGMGEEISREKAERILAAIKSWLAYDGAEGQHAYAVRVTRPLAARTGSN